MENNTEYVLIPTRHGSLPDELKELRDDEAICQNCYGEVGPDAITVSIAGETDRFCTWKCTAEHTAGIEAGTLDEGQSLSHGPLALPLWKFLVQYPADAEDGQDR